MAAVTAEGGSRAAKRATGARTMRSISTFRSLFLALLCLCSFTSLALPAASEERKRAIHLRVHAAWPTTRSSAEALLQITETSGPAAGLRFLSDFGENIEKSASTEPTPALSFREEYNLLKTTLDNFVGHSLTRSLTSWILAARHHSAQVHLHYTLAQQTLAAFTHVQQTPSIFAVRVDSTSNRLSLALSHSDLPECAHCAAAESPASPLTSVSARDHVSLSTHCKGAAHLPLLIVYAQFAHSDFPAWLKLIHALSEKCEFNIALRFWNPVTAETALEKEPHLRHPSLQPYLAHVTLKKTEYKVVDDRVFETRLYDDCPHAPLTPDVCKTSEETLPYQWEPGSDDANSTFTPLQLSQFILHKADGDFGAFLDHLQLSVEDLPAVTRSREFVDAAYFDKAVKKNAEKRVRKFRTAVSDREHFFINGYPFSVHSLRQGTTKLFGCLSALSSASMHLSSLAGELGRPAPPPLHPSVSDGNRIRVHIPVAEMLPKSFVWFNDLMKDKRYKKWSALDVHNAENVDDFVKKVDKEEQRTIPESMIHTKLVKARAHHLNLQVFVDPGDLEQFSYLSIPESVVRANLPIHVGAVLVPNGHVSKLIFACFHYFLRIKGKKTAVQFIGTIRQVLEYFGAGYRNVGMSDKIVELAFQQITSSMKSSVEYKSPEDLLEQDAEIKELLGEATKFAEDMKLLSDVDEEELGPDADPDAKKFSKLCILNGVVVKDVGRDVIPVAIREQKRVAALLRENKIDVAQSENMTSEQWVTSDPDVIVVNRLSRNMKAGGQGMGTLSRDEGLPTMQAVELIAVKDELRSVEYLGASDAASSHSVTVWLASKSQESDDFKRMEGYFDELAKSDFATRTQSRLGVISDSLRLHQSILKPSDPSVAGESAVIVINGRRLGASSIEGVHDLMVEIGTESQQQSSPEELESDLRLLHAFYSRETGQACGSEREDGQQAPRPSLEKVLATAEKSEVSSMRFQSGDASGEQKALSITAVVNPLDEDGLLATSAIRSIQDAFADNVHLDVFMMPYAEGMSAKRELPKTFYKFLMSPKHPFDDEDDAGSLASSMSFRRVPQDSVLTVAVEPPRAWFVGSYATNYDMDNVVLDSLPDKTGDLYSEYQLRNLIVEGSCIDELDAPPQGLKLILENDSGTSADTLVMSNLGYFQLKVPMPGKWWLSLAPGPSSMIFSLKSMYMFLDHKKFVYDPDQDGRIAVPVDALSGAGGILLRVTRKPGMEKKSVLDPEMAKAAAAAADGGDNMFGKLKSTFNRLYSRGKQGSDAAAKDAAKDAKPEVIHVFSVASGHLYERFLKIMISSVTRHASRPVKFWLLENYLSPPFKKALPAFAKRFGAEVGMVTYRWPLWLRAQTEKQRIIWAYKILFLDVLFPLDVERIVFVDSDQVIRGDLSELMDIDMKGAPYGYVPFCDSRKEVEGYRFWKQGFWKQTLGDAKYRISALYVVDLNRFRETAAGDNLRMIYQSLSADPNSLSNLDQDLPNYASANTGSGGPVVPIFNLPQEWLWCESWCDDESKKAAKAIDLCNNPMTKEPKLQSAKRIIGEWTSYDDAATEITEQIYREIMGVSAGAPEPTPSSERAAEGEGVAKEEL